MCEDNQYVRTLERLYQCRDLEISNLWQRSVFLSVFLILCFTGYGILVLRIIDYTSVLEWILFNLLSIVLSFVGCILSAIWVYMGKGSKAWYEVYETAIVSFEHKYHDKIGIPVSNIMGEMGIPYKKMNDCIFSMKSGAYSPSRINILIGQVCLIGWIVIGIVHSMILYSHELELGWTILDSPLIICLLPFVLAGICVFICWYLQTRKLRSKHLYDTLYYKNGLALCKRKEWLKLSITERKKKIIERQKSD